MIHVPVTLSVAVAKPITSKKDGKKYVAVEGMIFGLGIFKILLPENKVPDQLEGRTCRATFAVTIGQDLLGRCDTLLESSNFMPHRV